MSDSTRYREVKFLGARILQAAELNRLQDMARGQDDAGNVNFYGQSALYREGATLNVTVTITPGTKSVALSATDGSKPMLVFCRGRWEKIKVGEISLGAPLDVTQTDIYLTWRIAKITSVEDPTLIDASSLEETANMGELILSILPMTSGGATTQAGAAVAGTDLSKNTTVASMFNFTHSGVTVILNAQDNCQPQAQANSGTSGVVKLTTSTASGVAVATDDSRMTNTRSAADGSVHDSSVRVPVTAGGTNADGTAIFNLSGDIGGVSATKVILIAATQTLEAGWNWLKTQFNNLLARYNAHETTVLGLSNTHPMPTPAQVGAAPASHVGTALGLSTSHTPIVATSSGGFQVNRDSAIVPSATDSAYGVYESSTLRAGLTHSGDVFSILANAQSVTANDGDGPRTTSGALGRIELIAKVLSEHVNKTSHKNPHGLSLGDLGGTGVTQAYVDTQDVATLNSAKAYTDTLASTGTVRTEAVGNGTYVIFRFAPNSGVSLEVGYGTGTAFHGTSIGMPAGAGWGFLPQVSPNHVFLSGHPSHGIDNCSVSALTVFLSVVDGEGHVAVGTVNWTNLIWRSGF
jgi:hypothetical protein